MAKRKGSDGLVPGRLELGVEGVAIVRRPLRGRGTGYRLAVAYTPPGGREMILPLGILRAMSRAADELRDAGLTRGAALSSAVPEGVYEPPKGTSAGIDPDEEIL